MPTFLRAQRTGFAGRDKDFFVLTGGGRVRVDKEVGKDQPLHLASLVAKDFFGEIALLTGGTATATVTVESDVATLLVLPREAFERLVQDYPRIRNYLQQEAEVRQKRNADQDDSGGNRQSGHRDRKKKQAAFQGDNPPRE